MRGEDDHRHARLMLLDLGEQRHAVHLVHTQIADHQIDLFARQQAQRFLAAFGGGDVKTFAGQTHAQQLQQAGIVVNQTNWPVCVRSLRVGLLIGRVRRIGVFRFNRQRGAFSGSSCDSAPLAAAPFYRRIRPLRACAVVRDFPCSCLREESWRSISVRFSSLREVSCSCDCRRAWLWRSESIWLSLLSCRC